MSRQKSSPIPDVSDVIAENIRKKWLEEIGEKKRLEFEEHQKRVKKETRRLLSEQACFRVQIDSRGTELAALEKLCKREHGREECPDCSYEPW